jgi:hypothetical protein
MMTNWEKRQEEQRRLRKIAEAEKYVLTPADIYEGFMNITDGAKTGEWIYARYVWFSATKEIRTGVMQYADGDFRWRLGHDGAVAWKPFPADLDPHVVDKQLSDDYEAAKQARQKAAEKTYNDERHALLPRDLPVLAGIAAGCRLNYEHDGGYGWGRMSSTICKLIHPDGRVKYIAWASVFRLQYWKLVEACAAPDGHSHFYNSRQDYALTAEGIARAATCTKSLEEIFKQRKAAKAAQPQETTT